MVGAGPTFHQTHHPGYRQSHLLWVWVGRITSPMSSGTLGSLAQTHDTAWGYSGLLSSQCSPTQLHPGGLLLGRQVLPGSKAEDIHLFGSPVSIPEEAAAAIAPLEGKERFAEQEAV